MFLRSGIAHRSGYKLKIRLENARARCKTSYIPLPAREGACKGECNKMGLYAVPRLPLASWAYKRVQPGHWGRSRTTLPSQRPQPSCCQQEAYPLRRTPQESTGRYPRSVCAVLEIGHQATRRGTGSSDAALVQASEGKMWSTPSHLPFEHREGEGDR